MSGRCTAAAIPVAERLRLGTDQHALLVWYEPSAIADDRSDFG